MNNVNIWFIIGILLLLSEFLIPGFTIFFFGVGALITSLLLVIFPSLDAHVWLQVVIFTISSIVSLITLRKYFNKSLKGDLYKEREDYIGKECYVLEALSSDKAGRIMYNGTSWAAYSESGKLRKNQKVKILGKKPDNPMIFIVQKINKK